MTEPLTDRDALTRLLAEAQMQQAGAFLQALRGATRDLPLDEADDRFLCWLAGWDAETVAGVIRLLRLAPQASTPVEAPAALTDLDTLPDDELRQVVEDLRDALDRHDLDSPAGRYLFGLAAEAMNEHMRRRGVPTSA